MSQDAFEVWLDEMDKVTQAFILATDGPAALDKYLAECERLKVNLADSVLGAP